MSDLYNYTTTKQLKPEVKERLVHSYMVDSVYRTKTFNGKNVDKSLEEYLEGRFGYNHLHNIRSVNGCQAWYGDVVVRGLSGSFHLELSCPVAYDKSLELVQYLLSVKKNLNCEVEINLNTGKDQNLGEVFHLKMTIPKPLPVSWHEEFFASLNKY
tara:strand:- start:7595 stop:8062 length:468 start_codon:yes stop_codon:yes gene_type:complete